jgi:hypothetical protein
VNNLHDLLAGRNALKHILTDGSILNASDKRTRDLVVDIGFEQRAANFSQRFLDICLCQLTLASKFLENTFEFFA